MSLSFSAFSKIFLLSSQKNKPLLFKTRVCQWSEHPAMQGALSLLTNPTVSVHGTNPSKTPEGRAFLPRRPRNEFSLWRIGLSVGYSGRAMLAPTVFHWNLCHVPKRLGLSASSRSIPKDAPALFYDNARYRTRKSSSVRVTVGSVMTMSPSVVTVTVLPAAVMSSSARM